VANRLLEAIERQYWQPDAATLEALRAPAKSWKTASKACTKAAA
jgi:magnesium chelatase subunit H